MKIKNLAMRYISVETKPEESPQRLEVAFEILFEEVFKQIQDHNYSYKPINGGKNYDTDTILPANA